MSFRLNRPERLLLKALYGLEVAILFGLACIGLAAHDPSRPSAGLLLGAGLLLMAVGGTALFAVCRSGLGGEMLHQAKALLRQAPRRHR
jgi:hypothetical protein